MSPYTHEERDACGIGFVADSGGSGGRYVVDGALEALARVRHRGALASDGLTGDGAGLLLPIPHRIVGAGLRKDVAREPVGVAMAFLDPRDPRPGRAALESACSSEGLNVLGWRAVPTDEAALGATARASRPLIEQLLIAPTGGSDEAACERLAFRARRRAQKIARAERISLYVASLSFKTVTYKALCAADQLGAFYPDLVDNRFEAWFAIFHQRFATNTTPTWARAQPFRFLGHNGEINTIRGNRALLRAREGRFGRPDLIPEELLHPVVDPESSDSGILDEALEVLVRGGRSLEHAVTMAVPPAWENDERVDDKLRAFLAYHACLLEPWDGPAALVFSDGDVAGARLDRNGLRPMRIALCEDGFVACASEAGAVDTSGHGRVRRTRLGPGETFLVDPRRGGVVDEAELETSLAERAPYGRWLAERRRTRSTGQPVERPGSSTTIRQVAAGYSKEEFTVVIRPMAVDGAEPTSSMGDDTPQPPLAAHPRPLFNFLKQRFAQVTNPPIDHLRERHVMSLTTRLGRRAPLLQEVPEAAALRHYESPVLFPSAVAELEQEGAAVLDATFGVDEENSALEAACRRVADEAAERVRAGVDVLVLTDRSAGPERVAVPIALAAGAVHHRLLDEGLRSRASIVVDGDEPRETHHLACLITN
ncbi:MAG: glutamate synthase subunit alpha, partial [Actinomycetota bacterium]|nr:glutamate synthase subunit alpha [Actinomycetota bacterium]